MIRQDILHSLFKIELLITRRMSSLYSKFLNGTVLDAWGEKNHPVHLIITKIIIKLTRTPINQSKIKLPVRFKIIYCWKFDDWWFLFKLDFLKNLYSRIHFMILCQNTIRSCYKIIQSIGKIIYSWDFYQVFFCVK